VRTYLCRLDEVADGSARGFAPAADAPRGMFVVRRGDSVSGWLDSCPHVDGAPLAWRKDAYLSADRQSIVCYGHGAVFDLDTGLCKSGPCLGESLTRVMVERDPEGGLWAVAPVASS
jgi:nitrite reductase/ring-hydroxylating ferredoxin subunit